MTATKILLSELRKPEKNVRIHSDKQIKEFCRSVEMFGQLRPIVVDENKTILAGNGLYAALAELGWTEADCYVVTGLSEIEKKKLMLADNKIFSLGVDDIRAFDEIVMELDNDFDIPGYDPDLLQTLTFEIADADDMMSGYGIISEDTKAEMCKATEKYADEEKSFADAAEEITSTTPIFDSDASKHAEILESAQSFAEEEKPVLQQRYILCPKCGEKIWL